MPADAADRPGCPICRSTGPARCYDKPPALYFRCADCGFIFQHPLPAPATFVAYAEAEYQGGLYSEYVRARDMKLEHFRRRLALVRKHRQSGRLLDIGCSCGYFMEVASEAGFDVHGLEFSASAIAAAAPQIQSRIRQARVEELSESRDGRFDVITAFDIIEHLNAPLDFLSHARRLLSTEGVLVISTPDAGHWLRALMGVRWPMLQPMQHVSLFSGDALQKALREAGFLEIRITPALKVMSWNYLVGQLPTLNPLLYSAARTATRLLPDRTASRWRAVNIGEILAIATPTR
jgi:SAM-dependent methyltransferase